MRITPTLALATLTALAVALAAAYPIAQALL